jgi:hypothetical protein
LNQFLHFTPSNPKPPSSKQFPPFDKTTAVDFGQKVGFGFEGVGKRHLESKRISFLFNNWPRYERSREIPIWKDFQIILFGVAVLYIYVFRSLRLCSSYVSYGIKKKCSAGYDVGISPPLVYRANIILEKDKTLTNSLFLLH